MIHSFFFIPGNHPKLIEKLSSIPADYLIIDLEDSLCKKEIDESIQLISKINEKELLWVRPLLFHNDQIQLYLLERLLNFGFTNFVIPKIRNLDHINKVEHLIKTSGIENCSFIIIIENSECLYFIPEILKQTKLKIKGIGFGSQDYCAESGIKHSIEYLRYPRFIISNLAKTFGIIGIDTASMDINANQEFKTEIREAFNLGFEGKFIIHPKQLEVLQTFSFYSSEAIEHAKKIWAAYEQLGKPSIFIFEGRAIEQPHIKQLLKIIKWGDQYGKK